MSKRSPPQPKLDTYFVDGIGARRYLEARWGKQGLKGSESPWLFLGAAKLWARLTENPDSDRQTRDLLADVDELLATPLKKLKNRGVLVPELVVRVGERTRGEKRWLEYGRTLEPTRGSWRFRGTIGHDEVPGIHSLDVEKASQRAFDDAFLDVWSEWESEFVIHPDVTHELEFALAGWWRRFSAGRLERPQYFSERALMVLLLNAVALTHGLEMPKPTETRALALVALRGRVMEADKGEDLQQVDERWRKALKSLPRVLRRLPS